MNHIHTLLLCSLFPALLNAQEYKSGVEWQAPPVVTPGETNDQPPSDATVLFDGTDMSAWTGGDWKVAEGVVYSGKGYVTTKETFGDIQLHLEWSAPIEVKGNGQGRGNSGVFMMGRYEVQVLDSFENETYFDGQAGSIYKQTPPMVNAMRKPGEWNTYDIFWTAPRFKVNGDVASPAYVTLVHNGILVLNHFELMGPSSYVKAPHYEVHAPTGPISLQDHGNPVRFRNIWVRHLHPPVGQRTSAPYVIKGGKQISPAESEKSKADEQLKKTIDKAIAAAVEKLERKLDKQKKASDQEAAEKHNNKQEQPQPEAATKNNEPNASAQDKAT